MAAILVVCLWYQHGRHVFVFTLQPKNLNAWYIMQYKCSHKYHDSTNDESRHMRFLSSSLCIVGAVFSQVSSIKTLSAHNNEALVLVPNDGLSFVALLGYQLKLLFNDS
jgi:hypothetical protein